VALFVVLFEWHGEGGLVWRIGIALVYGAAVSAVVTLIFEKLFLIRLP
jgi:hypothetical protein